MTLAALLHFTEAVLWSILLFLSIAGYGALLLRLFAIRLASIVLAAISGFGVIIFLGGVLNLLNAITPAVLIALTVLGLLAAILLRLKLTDSDADLQDPAAPLEHPSAVPREVVALTLLAVVIVFSIRFAATVHWQSYQISDDYNFYLAAPKKMLQLHHLAADPFSERRIISSVGGNYFLQTIILAVLPLADIQMADRALGLLLLAFLAIALAAEFRLTPAQRAFFALLIFTTPQLQFNLTFVMLPSALFLALVYLAANRKLLDEHPALLALLLGAVTAVAATTKSTYLPHGVIFVACISLLHWRRRGFAAAVKTLLLAAVACLVIMIPWMIASHLTSGTWFYPSLGKGYQYSAYGLYPAPTGAGFAIIVHKVIPFCAPLLLLLALVWFLGDHDRPGEAILALSGAALFATLLVGIGTGGDSVRRYNYPCIIPALLLLYVVFSRRLNAAPRALPWRALRLVTVLFIVYTAYSTWNQKFTNEYDQIPLGLNAVIHETPIVSAPVEAEYAAVQRSIPTDAGVLATVSNPFLFDFRTHDIKIADWPGAASLPPGWPSKQDGEALAKYLLANNLRYLVYSYVDFSGFDLGAPHVIADPSRTQWIHSETQITYNSHHQFAELAHSRRHLYDDGQIYVLDLATPAAYHDLPPLESVIAPVNP
jgi:hypothetical protein